MNDQLASYLVEGGAARLLVARTTTIAESARVTHGLSPTACAALGRALTGSLFLASALKVPELSMTLGIYGDGPLGSIVCVANAKGEVKGCVDHPAAHPPKKPNGKLDVGAAVGKGRLTVLREAEHGPPYNGQVLLQSGEIADDIAWYLASSEGIPSLVALGVTVGPEGVICSAGAMLQPMPGCPEPVLRAMEQCAPLLDTVSSALNDLGTVDAFARYAVTGLALERAWELEPRYLCACSRRAIERVLLAMGQKELLGLAEEREEAEIVCHFCRTAYRFGREELRRLADAGATEEGAI